MYNKQIVGGVDKNPQMSPAPSVFVLGASALIFAVLFIVFKGYLSPLFALAIILVASLFFYGPVYFIAYRIGLLFPFITTKLKVLMFVLLVGLVLVFPVFICSLYLTD